MARTAEGWKLVWVRGIAHVRFRLQGRRHQITTRQRDSGKASEVASQIYADFVSGCVRRAASGALIHPSTPLEELCADWIVDIVNELGEGTDGTYEVYAKHWVQHFDTIGNVTSPNIGNYQRKRLGVVQKSTLIKERGGLRRFLTWCVEKELLREVPDFPALPKKATGTRHKQARRGPMVELSSRQVEAILGKLPELSLRSKRGRRFPVQAYFVFLYETGLRPEGTVDRLLGKDVTLAGLHIRAEVDKNRWERVVPLSARAQAAIASVGVVEPDQPIFGVHDRRVPWRQACLSALGPELGKLVTPYDLKHARVTHLAEAGAPATGITFLTGTESALNRYIHPSRKAAEAAIGLHSGDQASVELCEGEDLNLHGSYPTSTSSEIDRTNPEENKGTPSRQSAKYSEHNYLSGNGHPNPEMLEPESLEAYIESVARLEALDDLPTLSADDILAIRQSIGTSTSQSVSLPTWALVQTADGLGLGGLDG